MTSAFDEELKAGFDELAAEAGTAASGGVLKFKGVVIVGGGGGVLDSGTEEPMRADTKMGRVRRCRLMVARGAIDALAAKPKAGEAFTLGTKTLRIEDIEDEDPSDATVVYLVKASG